MVTMKQRFDEDDHYCGTNTPYYIVMHDTGNYDDSDEGNANFFCTGTRNASAHYFVDPDSITQVVRDYDGAWHCGDGGGRYGITNNNSIGIEMCKTKGTIHPTTIENAIWLVKKLQAQYGIPNDRVVRHYDASRKTCPASMSANNWRAWSEFKSRLAGGSNNVNVSTTPQPPTQQPGNGKYLNLHSNVKSWRVYPMSKQPTIGNECGSLAPSQFGGLSYLINEDRGDVKVITTSSFGRVQIYARPGDTDCSVTNSPKYGSGNTSGGSTSSNDNSIVKRYPENGTAKVLVSKLNVRSAPSTSSEVVASYSAGQTFTYNEVVITSGYVWVKYVAYSGSTRYVAVKNKSTGERLADCY